MASLDMKAEFKKMLKDMSDEEILALIRSARKEEPKHTGYEKANEYFYIGVDGDLHSSAGPINSLYDCANYYSDINVARECNRADTLMRKLRRFAAEHGGCFGPSGPNAWCITYNYPEDAFEVKCREYDGDFTPGIILFESEDAAKQAIDEFADELEWYFNYYDPMPRDWSRVEQSGMNTEIVNNVDEEGKFSFTREDYTHKGPVPPIYY